MQAIEVAKLLAVGGAVDHYEKAISHYYCELAEELLARSELSSARESVREAIGHDVNNPRTSLVRGRIDVEEGRVVDVGTVLGHILESGECFSE